MRPRWLLAAACMTALWAGCFMDAQSGSPASEPLLDEPQAPGCGDVAITEAASVLIWHTASSGTLEQWLVAQGHTVTTSTSLPADLTDYDVIWHVGMEVPVSASEQDQLADFLAAGGSVHLTGERSCCELLNASLTMFVNSVVVGGGITLGGQGDIAPIGGTFGFPYPVNEDAVGGIATTPNVAEQLRLLTPGGIAGLRDRANILAEGRQPRTGAIVPVAAAWDSDDLVTGRGRLTVMMDSNWLAVLNAADNGELVDNIQHFLQSAPVNRRPVAHAGPDQAAACLLPGQARAVTLDGTASSDPDGHALSYRWYEGSTLLGLGPVLTLQLEPGTHQIALIVSDGSCESEPDLVEVVLAPDTEPPSINLLGSNPAVIECGSVYVDPGATAQDACSGELTARIETTTSVDTGAAGAYAVTYRVSDDAGQVASASRTVLVTDSEPPVVEPAPLIELWPPNHAYHTFTLADCVAAVSDTCDSELDPESAGQLVSIYSDEPEDGRGDGNTRNDIVIVDPVTFRVRAERQGSGDGRVYGVTFTIADAAGNLTTALCRIGVPHDQACEPPVDSGPDSGYVVIAP